MTVKNSQVIIGIILLLVIGTLVGYFLKNKEIIPENQGIQLDNIKEGQIIKSPLFISGTVTQGKWAGFEGQMGRVELVESDGTILGLALLMATSDFMKFPATFEADLSFVPPKGNEVFLVFYNDNPSGLPENSAMMSIPVKVSQEKTKIILYFGKQGDDSCKNNYPIEREIIKVEGIARATIEELLKGLTEEEKVAGYFTSIPEGVKINSLTIVDGTATIDFNETLEQGVGGSCRVLAIREQIIKTLMQFSSVQKVIISINGRTEDILQP